MQNARTEAGAAETNAKIAGSDHRSATQQRRQSLRDVQRRARRRGIVTLYAPPSVPDDLAQATLPSAEPSPKLAALRAKALAYLGGGLEPIGVTGKRPTTIGWQDGEITEERLRSLFLEEHTGIGLRTGRLVGADIDIQDEELVAAVRALIEGTLGLTPFVRVGNAPKIILAYRNAMPTAKIRVEGVLRGVKQAVEFLGVGQQVVTLGIHPDTKKLYRWIGTGGELKRLAGLPEVTPDELATLAKDGIAKLFRDRGFTDVKVTGKGIRGDGAAHDAQPGEGVLPDGDPRIALRLADVRRQVPEFIRDGERDNELLSLAQKCADRGIPPADVAAFLLEVIAERVERGSEFVGEVDRLVRQGFRETRENALGSRKAPFEEILLKSPPAGQTPDSRQVDVYRLADLSAHGALSTNQYGKPTASFENCFLVVSHLTAVPRYNAFSDRVEFNEAPPWGDGSHVWSDDMGRKLRAEIMREFGVSFELGVIHEAVRSVALYHRFDPQHDYLNGLVWDKEAGRVDTWLIRLAGAADTPYVRAVSRKTLIGAAARALNPGCKFDTALILESATGRNKSQALAILAVRDAWFSDALAGNLRDKDAVVAVQGKWLVEVGEVEKLFRKNEAAELKSYLSRRIDTIRRPFGRVAEDLPRRFILIGTTNSEAYLNDPTGNRRFWPVKISKFDLDALKAERDQLWAEAVAAYCAGESLVLPEDLWATAADEQEQRRAKDPWEDAIAEYLARDRQGHVLTRLHSRDLLDKAIGLPRGQQTTEAFTRLRAVMALLGWDYHKSLKIRGMVSSGYSKRGTEGQGEDDAPEEALP
jgi:predicted P-loop ATPase